MLETLSDRSSSDTAGPCRAGPPAVFLRIPARFDILSRRVPALGGTEAEQAAMAELTRRLGDLNGTIGDFRAGLELMQHAESGGAFHASWGPIAARDAALALTNFRATLKAIGEALKGVKSLRGTRARLKPVEGRFAVEFQVVRAGRAALNGSADGARGGAAGPRGRDAISDAILLSEIAHDGRRVRHRSEGRELRFELSEHALWRLVALRDEAFAAFEAP